VDLLIINYQGLGPSVHPHDFRSGFLIGLVGVHLFNDHIAHMRSSIWILFSDIKW